MRLKLNQKKKISGLITEIGTKNKNLTETGSIQCNINNAEDSFHSGY